MSAQVETPATPHRYGKAMAHIMARFEEAQAEQERDARRETAIAAIHAHLDTLEQAAATSPR